MRHVCSVKMRIAPCEFEMFCPKCGLIKNNVFFFFTSTNRRYREKQKKKNNKKIITCSEGSNIFLQRKGLGIDILLIEEVVVVYHAVNELLIRTKIID